MEIICSTELVREVVGGEVAEAQERWRCVMEAGASLERGDPGTARHRKSRGRQAAGSSLRRGIVSDTQESISHF